MTAPQNHLTETAIARARLRFDLIAADLPLKRRDRELFGLCPFHSEKTPSFYVIPDKGFFTCFGCGAHGTAIDYVMRKRGLSFADAVHEINGTASRCPPKAAPVPVRMANRSPPNPDNRSYVEALLRTCQPVESGTAAHLYLYLRGLISPFNRAPTEAALAALRAHPALYCSEIGANLPALVAPVTTSQGITAAQRIYVLNRVEFVGGAGPKDSRAPLETRKKTIGPMLDGAVRLGAPRRALGLAEGVETAIAAAIINRGMPVWATCGAARLGHVAIPDGVEMIRIYGDNGAAGEELAERAAYRYHDLGYRTELRFPPAKFDDWNDALLALEAGR